MGKVLEFYRGEIPNQEGLCYKDIMQFDDDELEKNHSYIQWLFPLKEPSMVVPGSPVLDEEDIQFFSTNWKNLDEMKDKIEIRKNLLDAFNKMMKFYGFSLSLKGDEIKSVEFVRSQDFQAKAFNWVKPKNHNFLRITRILRSLNTLGNSSTADMMYKCLCEVYEDYNGIIGPLTKQFWDEAMGIEDDD